MKQNLVLVLVIVALVIGITALFSGNTERVVEREIKEVGAAAGPDHFQRQYFHEGFESGGVGAHTASSTVESSQTLETAFLEGNDYIELTPTVGAVTLTLPATTTAGFSNVVGSEVGSKRVIEVFNATTTTGSASVITWAAGTGIDLQEDEGETVTQNGLEIARITLIRKADSDVVAWIEAGQAGD